MTLPNFLVIGAQRAGTTLLHRILESHPEVFVPYRRKEVHYFDRYFDRGVEWYEKFFPPSNEAQAYRGIGEVTPDYIFEQEVPGRIHAVLPDCRLIVSLRNPVDRAYSAYFHAIQRCNEKRSVADFLVENEEALQRGRYSQQLIRYFELFSKEAVLIVVYEELIIDPAGQLARIATFLGLDRSWDNPDALMRERPNASFTPRFRTLFAYARRFGVLLRRNDLDWVVRLAKSSGLPKLFGRSSSSQALPESTRRMLEEYYFDEVATLGTLLGLDLYAWWDGFRRTGMPSGSNVSLQGERTDNRR